MPSKKKKYNARFPPARIKKIMQTDEDVGKVAAAVPVIISRALELFIESLILKSNDMTQSRNARTLSTAHIKHIIESEKKFDFLRDLVASMPNMADLQQAEEDDDDSQSGPESTDPTPTPIPCPARHPRQPRQSTATAEANPSQPTKRPRGRPKKQKIEEQTLPPKKQRRKKRKREEMSDDSATEDANSKSGSGESTEEAMSPAAYRTEDPELTGSTSQGMTSMPFAQYMEDASQSDSSPCTAQYSEPPHSTPNRKADSHTDIALNRQSRTELKDPSLMHDCKQREALKNDREESKPQNKLIRGVENENDRREELRLNSASASDQRITLGYSEHSADQQDTLRRDIKHETDKARVLGMENRDANIQEYPYTRDINCDGDRVGTLRNITHENDQQEILRLESTHSSDQREPLSLEMSGVPSGDQSNMPKNDRRESMPQEALKKDSGHTIEQREALKLEHARYYDQKDETKNNGDQREVLRKDVDYYNRLRQGPGQGVYPPGAMTHSGLPPHLPSGVCPYPVPTQPGLAPNVNSCSVTGVPMPGSYPGPMNCQMPPAQLGGQPTCTVGPPPYNLSFYGLPHTAPLIPSPRSTADRDDSDS